MCQRAATTREGGFRGGVIPDVDKPPRIRLTMTPPKVGLSAEDICQILTRKSDACCVGQRPISSDQGAQSSIQGQMQRERVSAMVYSMTTSSRHHCLP